MAADRSGIESVLSRLDDLGPRLATAKSVADLQESAGRLATAKQVIELQESILKLVADVKSLRSDFAEAVEAITKSQKKIGADIIEAVEAVPEGDGEETQEAIEKTVEKYVGEAKGALKFLVGDDPETIAALRGRVRDWIGKKGKKALGGGEED